MHQIVDTAALVRELTKVGTVAERGRAFGILAAQVQRKDFEIAFPRRDVRVGSDEQSSVRDAFSRRDLTINAIGWDPATGEIIDLFGGLGDLRSGVLRATSSAFRDDPLRVWRVVQFAGRFGFQVDDQTAAACKEVTLKIRTQPDSVAPERVWMEWSKLLRTGCHWQAATSALVATGAIRLVPELEATLTVPQDPAWHPEGNGWKWRRTRPSAQRNSITKPRSGLSARDWLRSESQQGPWTASTGSCSSPRSPSSSDKSGSKKQGLSWIRASALQSASPRSLVRAQTLGRRSRSPWF